MTVCAYNLSIRESQARACQRPCVYHAQLTCVFLANSTSYIERKGGKFLRNYYQCLTCCLHLHIYTVCPPAPHMHKCIHIIQNYLIISWKCLHCIVLEKITESIKYKMSRRHKQQKEINVCKTQCCCITKEYNGSSFFIN